MSEFTQRQADELDSYRARHGEIASAHEAYALILEEIDELWDQVRLRHQLRMRENMLEELVQIASKAQRAAEDLGLCAK